MARAQNTYDAFIRHAVGLKNLDISESNKFAKSLNKELKELEKYILNRGVLGKNITIYQTNRLNDLISSLGKRHDTIFKNLRRGVETSLAEIGVYESEFVTRLLNNYYPIDLALTVPTTAQIITAVNLTPNFIGKTLFSRRHFRDSNMWDDLSRATKEAITNTTRSAFLRGSSVSGAKRQLSLIYPRAESQGRAFMRTALQFTANTTRLLTYEQNKDIIKRVRYSAILDSKTSDICQGLDGIEYVLGRDVVRNPPQHFNCRSTLIPITVTTDYDIIERKTLNSTEFNRRTYRRLRGEAKKLGVPYKPYRDNYFKDKIGKIKLSENYGDFFARQSSDFQRAVLGKGRYEIFKEKGLSLRELINPKTEKYFTLKDLKTKFDI